jgi:hypothetical protein
MGADMQVSFVGCARKSLKWYKKVFFHLIDLSLYNSYVMFQVKTGEKPSFSDFRLKIVTQIIEQYAKKPSTIPRPPTIDNPVMNQVGISNSHQTAISFFFFLPTYTMKNKTREI